MAVLLDLLSPYPILENIVSSLTIGDLFNLSKVNSVYRSTLHGFEGSCFGERRPIANRGVRSALQIGFHRTVFWENLKRRSQLRCSEPHHIRGTSPTGCLLCSAPVCEACIIKASFAKRNENTFQNRHRPLCFQCWDTGKQHMKHSIQVVGTIPRKSYPDQAAEGEFCTCTARNGHLCLACKTEQNNMNGPETCYGQDCPNSNPEGNAISMEGRVCLWCSRQLPGSRSRAESRRNYDARYLFARSISSYDRSSDDQDLDTFEEQRMLEDDTLSRRREESRGCANSASSHYAGEQLSEVARHGSEPEIPQLSEVSCAREWPLLSSGPRIITDLQRYEDQRFDVQGVRTANG